MNSKKNGYAIPRPVLDIGKELLQSKHSAYLVGGCVRDLFLGRKVKDWDIATSAKPEQIVKLFPESFYNNTFGTVGVKVNLDGTETQGGTPVPKIIEITTFRKEGQYSDARHPDKVIFAKSIEEDLERRDFTINALAINFNIFVGTSPSAVFLQRIHRGQEIIPFEQTLLEKGENRGPGLEGETENLLKIKEIPHLGFGKYPSFTLPKVNFSAAEKTINKLVADNFGGLPDLEAKLIRAVGNPDKRLQEDALRLMRSVRFAVQLGFKIEKRTAQSIKKNANLLKNISKERIRDELTKILLSPWPAEGIELLRKLGLLHEILPILEEGMGIKQNWHHIYSVYKHSILSLKFCFSDSLELRLASLLHDAAKPKVKNVGEDGKATFYFHEVEGSKMARRMLEQLRFPTSVVEEVAKLVYYHMFNFDPALHNESTVRRLLHRVGGIERMRKLLLIRIADRLGSGCKKGEVFKLRKLKYLVDKVSKDPISLKQLKINGKDIMDSLKIKPGPQIGNILDILLATIIVKPQNNHKETLLELAKNIWFAEKKSPGFLKEEHAKAKEYLRGKMEDHDIALQEKHKVREKKFVTYNS